MIKSFWSFAIAAVVFVGAGVPSLAADPAFCDQYARLAVHEAQVLSTLPCFRGFDRRWNLNYQAHFQWCLTADYGAATAERDYRRMRVYQCGGS
jgi:hypothetical protein